MRRPTVLHADPHSDTRQLLSCLLDMYGITVVEADSGPAALDLALGDRPDVVVAELTLPILDGCALAARLKSTPGLKDVPLIAWTAAADERSRTRALAAGFDRVVVKAGSCDVIFDLLALLRVRGEGV